MLFTLCLQRVPFARRLCEVLARLPQDVLEKLFAPLRDFRDPHNRELRSWLACDPQTLPLRGRMEVCGTDPAESVRAVCHCEELKLLCFDLSELSCVTFANLTHLYVHLPVPDARSLLGLDDIVLPALKSLGMVVSAEDSMCDLAVLLDLMRSANVRRCEIVSLRVASSRPLRFPLSVFEAPRPPLASSVRALRLDVDCTHGMDVLLLSRLWTDSIRILIVRIDDRWDAIDASFDSVHTLALLPREHLDWTVDKIARVCGRYFPRVVTVVARCEWSCKDELTPFLRGLKHMWLGDGHPFNRGLSQLKAMLE